MSWPMVALGEIFEIARGGSPRPIDNYVTDSPDGLNWISISDATRSGKTIYQTERRIRPEGLAKSRWVEPGDFLLSNSMSFGRPYIMGTTGCIHDGWLVLKGGRERADPDYLYHLLGSEPVYAQFAKRATGTTVRNLNTEIVSETQIPLPPLPEQRRIAGILDQADALRRLRRQSLSRLSDLGLAIFHEMFGDFLDAEAQGRTDILGNFCNIQVGFPFKSGSYTESPEGIMLCRGANVLPNRLDWSDMVRYPLDLAKPQMDFALQQDDVVIAMDRPWISSGFKAARVTGRDLPSLLVQRVARLRGKESFDNQFILDLVRSYKFQRYCKPTETTIPHISPVEIRNFSFIVPPEHARREYEKKVAFLDRKFFAMNEAAVKSAHLFASLQHRAFRGEI